MPTNAVSATYPTKVFVNPWKNLTDEFAQLPWEGPASHHFVVRMVLARSGADYILDEKGRKIVISVLKGCKCGLSQEQFTLIPPLPLPDGPCPLKIQELNRNGEQNV